METSISEWDEHAATFHEITVFSIFFVKNSNRPAPEATIFGMHSKWIFIDN